MLIFKINVMQTPDYCIKAEYEPFKYEITDNLGVATQIQYDHILH